MTTARVFSASMCEPVTGAEIRILDRSGSLITKTSTSADGSFSIDASEPDSRVEIRKPNYVDKRYPIDAIPRIVRLLETNLIGYQDRLWFKPGETVAVRVQADTEYSACLYRHGMNKELVLDLGSQEQCRQVMRDGYFVETGAAWGKSFSYSLPPDIRPGLFSVLLSSESSGRFAIPMIVSTPPHARGDKARLLVLASTNTWQSYNIWGGRSRYRNFEDETGFIRGERRRRLRAVMPRWLKYLRAEMMNYTWTPPDWMFKRLSVQRPCSLCELEGSDVYSPFTNKFAALEWRFLAWLEREEVDYDIVSGAELDLEPEMLSHYSAVAFVGHSEYWSKRMYESVRDHHEHDGLWILNFSGNTMYREIEFFKDGSTRCVSTSFRDSCADETRILGVRYNAFGYGTCAPYKVLEPDSWVFSGLKNLRRGSLVGAKCLDQPTPVPNARFNPGRPSDGNLAGVGASGWETDKKSRSAPADVTVVAKGKNGPLSGAHMVVREPEGTRGGLFSASSIVFPASPLVDQSVSRIALNAIARATRSQTT